MQLGIKELCQVVSVPNSGCPHAETSMFFAWALTVACARLWFGYKEQNSLQGALLQFDFQGRSSV